MQIFRQAGREGGREGQGGKEGGSNELSYVLLDIDNCKVSFVANIYLDLRCTLGRTFCIRRVWSFNSFLVAEIARES